MCNTACPRPLDCLQLRGWHILWTAAKDLVNRDVIVLDDYPAIIADADLTPAEVCDLVRQDVHSRPSYCGG